MQQLNLDPNVVRWREASQNSPKNIKNHIWKTVGLVALAVLIGGGAVAGSGVMLHYGCRFNNRGLALGGAMALLASGFVAIVSIDGTASFCFRYYDWNRYHKAEVAHKVSRELLDAPIEQLALEELEMPNTELRNQNRGYINLENYERNGIIGKIGEDSVKEKLLRFRRDYRAAREQMQAQYQEHRPAIDRLARSRAEPDLNGVHADLKPYYTAKATVERITAELKGYQRDVLSQHVPLPLAQQGQA